MAFRPPSLRALEAFEASARTLSFTEAAAELNLTPGAVSHAIAGLEERVGARLFQRGRRGVVLTEAGQLFAARVRLGLTLIRDAFGAEAAEDCRRILTLSILPAVAARVLAPRLPELRSAFPDVMFDIRVSSRLEDFRTGQVDMAVRFGPGGWAGLQSRRLANETLFPVCAPAYLDGRTLSTARDLASADLIDHPESGWSLWFDGTGVEASNLRPALRLDDAALVLDAAAAGCGVALARRALVRDDLAAGRLVRLSDREVPAEYGYACVWKARGADAALFGRVADWFEAALAPLLAAGEGFAYPSPS